MGTVASIPDIINQFSSYVISMLLNIFASLSSKKASAAQRMSSLGTTHMFIYVLGNV